MLAALALRLGISSFLLKIILGVILAGALWASFAVWKHSIYMQGWNAADAMWQEKALEAKIEKLEREKKVAEQAAADESAKNDELEAEKAELEQKNDAYEEELKKRPDQCLLGDDADRLQ